MILIKVYLYHHRPEKVVADVL